MGIGRSAFWRGLFSPNGRTSREDFWAVTLLVWVVVAIAGFNVGLSGDGPIALVTAFFVLLASLPINLFNSVKRLHDMGLGGWWVLMAMVCDTPIALMAEPMWPDPVVALGMILQALYGLAILLILGAWPGESGPNRFGDPPGLTAKEPA